MIFDQDFFPLCNLIAAESFVFIENQKFDLFLQKLPAAARPNLTEDPTEKIQQLFKHLDKKFFQSELSKNGVLLEWNEQSSKSAGYCYELNDAIKKSKRVFIVLNKPLLMLRRREDVVETLMVKLISEVTELKQ